MVVPVEITARGLLGAFQVAERWLATNRDGINAINVYPVPDGDTGTNMLLTWRSAIRAAPEGEERVGPMLQAVARGALLGARGNSGVILSQMLRGLAEALEHRTAIDTPALVEAFLGAWQASYGAISDPVEGTMLTVMREAAAEAEEAARTTSDMEEVMRRVVEEAHRSVERTPDLLPRLRDAGVVDAGGMGVAVILQGLAFALSGQEPPEEPLLTSDAQVELSGVEHEGHGYCTEFLLEGAKIDRSALQQELEQAGGESILVVGDDRNVHVHVHVEDPGTALSAGVRRGSLTGVKVDNMQAQHEEWAAAKDDGAGALPDTSPLPPVGLVAVARGGGITQAFRELGARQVLTGGATGKASAGELLEAARKAGREHVILLPNDKDVLMAARQAAEASDGFASVVPSRSVAAGLSAAIAYMPEGDPESIAEAMREALEAVRCVEVTTSVRAATVDGVEVNAGDAIAFLDGRLVLRADGVDEALVDGLHEAGAGEAEIVTIYLGADADDAAGERIVGLIEEAFPGVEVEVLEGDQPHYPYIAGVE